jgi:hypothetical protein
MSPSLLTGCCAAQCRSTGSRRWRSATRSTAAFSTGYVEFHRKLADAIRDVLLVLAAEERAHDWMLGAGAQTDRATGGVLKPAPEEWPGLSLEALARHAALDSANGGYDGRFVEILLSLQGVLAVSRGEVGAPRYRVGLKGLTEQIAAHPLLGRRLASIHARLAPLTLDAIDTLAKRCCKRRGQSGRFGGVRAGRGPCRAPHPHVALGCPDRPLAGASCRGTCLRHDR